MQSLFRSQDAHTHIVLVNSDKACAELKSLFSQVINEKSWQVSFEVDAYPRSSVYFGLQMHRQLIGGLQLVTGNKNELLPVLEVWPELELRVDSTVADIALLALDREHRGHGQLFWLLCIEMWRYCCQNGITSLWAEVTPAKLRIYRRFGWPFEVAGPLRLHWGEECYPCRMATASVEQVIAEKAATSPLYGRLLQQAYRPEYTASLSVEDACAVTAR